MKAWRTSVERDNEAAWFYPPVFYLGHFTQPNNFIFQLRNFKKGCFMSKRGPFHKSWVHGEKRYSDHLRSFLRCEFGHMCSWKEQSLWITPYAYVLWNWPLLFNLFNLSFKTKFTCMKKKTISYTRFSMLFCPWK